MNNVSGQFIHDTIPPSRDCGCARCQMLEVKIERLNKLMQGWDKAINEVKIEALEELLAKQIISVFDIEKRIEELKSEN